MTKKNWKADWPRPNSIFSGRLQGILPNMGLSKIAQEYFLGASKNTVFKYLSGDSEPTVSQILRVAEATRCNASWLLTGVGEPFEGKGDMMAKDDEAQRRKEWAEKGKEMLETPVCVPSNPYPETIGRIPASTVKESRAAEAIFRLQMALSNLQLHLAEAGHHVADQQTLKNFAGLDQLLTSLQHLESPMKALLGPLLSYQRMRAEERNEDPHRPDDGKNHVHTA